MILDQTIERHISARLLADNKEKEGNHKSSGKLSASRLGWPLQWQILHSLGIDSTPIDAYTLRKFLRGSTVEDWLVSQIPGIVETQKFVEYRKTVGYVDIIVDSSVYEHKVGIIPHEVKSVTNAKFARLNGAPDDQHCLQAALYALALKKDWFAIDYVAADDLRVRTYVVETKKFAGRVDSIIELYQKTKKSGVVPVFEPLYSWQKNKMYNSFPEWSELKQEEINEKIIKTLAQNA